MWDVRIVNCECSVSPTRSPAHRPLPHTAAVAFCGVTKIACRHARDHIQASDYEQSEVHADTRHRGTSEGDRRRVGGDVGSIATEADNPAKNAPRNLTIGSSNC